jgi:hypothetical protein
MNASKIKELFGLQGLIISSIKSNISIPIINIKYKLIIKLST